MPDIPIFKGRGIENSNRSDSGHASACEKNLDIIQSMYECISGPFHALELSRTTQEIPSGCLFIIPAVPANEPVLVHVPLTKMDFHPTGAKLLFISVINLT